MNRQIRSRTLATLAMAVVMAAPAALATSETSSPEACSAGERASSLRAEQSAVLRLLGADTPVDVTTIENEADLAALAALGYDVYPHHQVSVAGMGWTAFNPAEDPAALQPGRPNLLFYEPYGETVIEPHDGFDFPYQLAGWGYVPLSYDVDEHPAVLEPCITRDDWFVHERMIHRHGRIENHPPEEDVHGTSPGAGSPDECVEFISPSGDICHARSWDIHLWLGHDGIARVSILNPGVKIPGVDPQMGKAFFSPPRPDET